MTFFYGDVAKKAGIFGDAGCKLFGLEIGAD